MAKKSEITQGEAMLGLLLAYPHRWADARAGGLCADWFARAGERRAYEVLEAMEKRGQHPDIVSFRDEAAKIADAPHDLPFYERVAEYSLTDAYLGQFLNRMREAWVARRIEAMARGAISEIVGGGAVPTEIAMKIAKEARAIAAAGAVGETDKGAELAAQTAAWEAMAANRDGADSPNLPLPWNCLNNLLGGLRPGLHIVGARASEGKTFYAVNVSRFWMERNIPHAFVSLDMPTGEVLSRLVSMGSGVALRRLERGYAAADELARARAEAGAVNAAPIHMTEEANIDRLCAWLRSMAARHGVKAVIIDYIQLCRGGRTRRLDDVAECVLQLKRTAIELKMPIMALSQLSRAAESAERDNPNAVPMLADLSDSSELEKAASSVILIYRDKKKAKEWRDAPPTGLAPWGDSAKWLRPVWLAVAKNQQGRAGVKVPFILYPECFIMRPGDYDKKDAADGAFEFIRDDWRVLPGDDDIARMGRLGNRACRDD